LKKLQILSVIESFWLSIIAFAFLSFAIICFAFLDIGFILFLLQLCKVIIAMLPTRIKQFLQLSQNQMPF
jgi:hypothetical protein